MIRRARNKVTRLINDKNELVTNKGEVKAILLNYFKSLFGRDESCDLSVAPRDCFPPLSTSTREEAFRTITVEEIKTALNEMAPLKAPGPDGLHAVFYQNMWSVVGKSVISMAENFFATREFPNGMNKTTIALIPKIEFPERPLHFRPIGLCNVNYKIISKVMTNRLKEAIKEVIGPHQSSFVLNR